MYCKNCGKEIDDSSYTCPFCYTIVNSNNDNNFGNSQSGYGHSQNSVNNYHYEKETNSDAIVGFILSFFSALLGWIFGGIGLYKANRLETRKGHGLSVAAITISTINFILSLIVFSFQPENFWLLF